MSGVCGCSKIQSRNDFDEIFNEVNELISGFIGFKSLSITGSYNSDLDKTEFGDMDLITHIDGDIYCFDKKEIKKELAQYFFRKSPNIVTKFTSEKYSGRRYYNSGEIITIAFKSKNDDIEVAQIDFIISMDEIETKFKLNFLDMPAQKQGMVLGLIKTVLIEEDIQTVFNRIGIKEPLFLDDDQEYEFNLSSMEVQLRKVTYHIGTLKQKSREIVWTSRDWNTLEKIIKQFNINNSFDDLIDQSKRILENPRSSRRLAGVFKSMISIKSGEIGTEKGKTKQLALDLIHNTFGEK